MITHLSDHKVKVSLRLLSLLISRIAKNFSVTSLLITDTKAIKVVVSKFTRSLPPKRLLIIDTVAMKFVFVIFYKHFKPKFKIKSTSKTTQSATVQQIESCLLQVFKI
ncbi:hypothetical protein MtrunA17_Chr6g0479011 [Medicago truncatula]|uniref:Uncharacterized protein n=1 Tax=Medicago truncatula TaxID=3880 RepID=A0A072UBA3_MEDTR|nr:hypothetical protein MTR_6g472310 [Medicago truncatula]RHN52299.1 hypothetical protein MtrunA17_Chr6g0479011 [Medicago truncatula]